MRHGRPVLDGPRWRSPAGMAAWIAAYDASEVDPASVPPASVELAARARHVVCSDLPRALSSVRALGVEPTAIDAIYREAQLPTLGWDFPRLPDTLHACCLRLLWALGFSAGVESLGLARARARCAGLTLVALAATGRVLLLGHGVMNRLIVGELVKLGWTSSERQGSGYWLATRLLPAVAPCNGVTPPHK